MAGNYAGKVLFTLVVDSVDLPSGFVDAGTGTFSNDARVNVAARMNGGEPRVEQISFYYDRQHGRGVFTGVADGKSLFIMTDQGPTVERDADNRAPVVEAFAVSVLTALDFQVSETSPKKPNCTWTIVPLNELGNGYGTLVVAGMAGHSGD